MQVSKASHVLLRSAQQVICTNLSASPGCYDGALSRSIKILVITAGLTLPCERFITCLRSSPGCQHTLRSCTPPHHTCKVIGSKWHGRSPCMHC